MALLLLPTTKHIFGAFQKCPAFLDGETQFAPRSLECGGFESFGLHVHITPEDKHLIRHPTYSDYPLRRK
jgi:hypothetical protein